MLMRIDHRRRIFHARFILKLALRSCKVFWTMALMWCDAYTVVQTLWHANWFAVRYRNPFCTKDVPPFLATSYSQLGYTVWKLVILIASGDTAAILRTSNLTVYGCIRLSDASRIYEHAFACRCISTAFGLLQRGAFDKFGRLFRKCCSN